MFPTEPIVSDSLLREPLRRSPMASGKFILISSRVLALIYPALVGFEVVPHYQLAIAQLEGCVYGYILYSSPLLSMCSSDSRGRGRHSLYELCRASRSPSMAFPCVLSGLLVGGDSCAKWTCSLYCTVTPNVNAETRVV